MNEEKLSQWLYLNHHLTVPPPSSPHLPHTHTEESPCEDIMRGCQFTSQEVYHSVQFSSVVQLCLTLCDPMNHSKPGIPVHHQLPEFTQTHIHRVCDAIQPSHPLLSPFLLPSFPGSRSFPMSQHLTSGGQSIRVSASTLVLPMNTQD